MAGRTSRWLNPSGEEFILDEDRRVFDGPWGALPFSDRFAPDVTFDMQELFLIKMGFKKIDDGPMGIDTPSESKRKDFK